ncbi:MAG: ABC transporter ATP-binding protein, partial [Acidobacteriaceae bacterium]|nr:ABC transporter ATP-binding protein [Acidobacteriaceae bacterium]
MAQNNGQATFSAWRERLAALKNIPPVLRIVWRSGPYVVFLGLICRVFVSLVPVSAAWVTRLIIDNITAIVRGRAPLTAHLWWLVSLEFGIVVAGNVFGRLIDYYDAVLADRYTRHVSIEVMNHASQLD